MFNHGGTREREREGHEGILGNIIVIFVLFQELTCREELLTLLLSLLPLVWKIPVQEEKAPGQYIEV